MKKTLLDRWGPRFPRGLALVVAITVMLAAVTVAPGGRGRAAEARTSTFILPTTPANAIRAFYAAINAREYPLASKFVAGSAATWRAVETGSSYRDTRHVTIGRLVVGGYRIRQPGEAFTCVGARITAVHTDGSVQAFGGWYMTFRQIDDFWRILLTGSRIEPGGAFSVPTRAQCAALVPRQYRPSGVATVLGAVDFLSATTGWAVTGTSQAYMQGGCEQGIGTGCNRATMTVVETTDGGRSWTRWLRFKAPPYVAPYSLPLIILLRFVNARDGFLSVPTNQGHISSGIFYRTQNGGASWQRLRLPGAPAFGEGPAFSFIDPRHGWLLADVGAAMGQSSATIYRTGNGGTSWQEVSHTGFRHPNQGLGLGGDKSSIVFRSRTVGWVTATTPVAPLISVTYDGGVRWYHQFLPPLAPQSSTVTSESLPGVPQCFNARDCVFPVTASIIDHPVRGHTRSSPDHLYVYQSHDGGSSWPLLHRLPGYMTAAAPLIWQFLDANRWWVSGADRIWTSANGGQSWTAHREHLPSGFHIISLDFVDARHGWAPAVVPNPDGDFARRSALLTTSDGGIHWRLASAPVPGTTKR